MNISAWCLFLNANCECVYKIYLYYSYLFTSTVKELGTKKGKKTSIFVVSGQYPVYKCMDLSDIVQQGSILKREGWDWLFG